MTAEYSDLRSSIPMLMDWIGVIRLCAMLSGIITIMMIIMIMMIMMIMMIIIRIRGSCIKLNVHTIIHGRLFV
jgi:hypothetical protein